ncbi:galactose-3-O-sulfotransferase 2-like, partial [Mya arenaria]|uniref:galactose-3-O-sulfotransferase 2-like n=1 Tax=Mya arenaria TaxID=6604 RepID=UPI0022E82D17
TELLNVTVTSDVYSRSKVTHVGFLKVHKAGSTTMQNLFFRFGIKHKLNVVIPKSGNYLLKKSKAMPPKYSDHYDIFACHTVYSNAWYSALLPKDAMRIAIIREPLDRMISAAYYYRDVWGVGYLKNVPKANFIHNIIQKPETYDRAFFSRTKNSMGKDFGFSKNTAKDNTTIRNYLQQLDNEFSLVMLTEHMDESLVMMRRLLNWSISDIIYLSTNTHKHNPTLLNQSELIQFKKTNILDYAIYEYFSVVFEEKMKALGQDLKEEVSFVKKCLTSVYQFCQRKENINVTYVEFESSKWDTSFRITRTDCDWMNTKELAFIAKLRKMYST